MSWRHRFPKYFLEDTTQVSSSAAMIHAKAGREVVMYRDASDSCGEVLERDAVSAPEYSRLEGHEQMRIQHDKDLNSGSQL